MSFGSPVPALPLEILLEDGPVIAVNKPAGLLTQAPPSRDIPSLESQVKSYLKERYHKPGNVYLGIPHRLDRPVSGVLVFARNSKAARRLAEQFQSGQVEKVYWAVAEVPPTPPHGTLRDWLMKLPQQARAEIVAEGTPQGRECSLEYRTLTCDTKHALLEVVPHSGRMHQIRLQFASRGWPLVGDVLYGAQTRLLPHDDPRSAPIALHARRIRFLHPVRYTTIEVIAPLPDAWKSLSLGEHVDI